MLGEDNVILHVLLINWPRLIDSLANARLEIKMYSELLELLVIEL